MPRRSADRAPGLIGAGSDSMVGAIYGVLGETHEALTAAQVQQRLIERGVDVSRHWKRTGRSVLDVLQGMRYVGIVGWIHRPDGSTVLKWQRCHPVERRRLQDRWAAELERRNRKAAGKKSRDLS